MKSLIYSTNSIMEPHFGCLIEEAEEQLSKGFDVTFAFCGGFAKTCYVNPTSSPVICAFCRWNQRRLLKRFQGRCKTIELSSPLKSDRIPFVYGNEKDIKAIKYKNVSVGYGVLSSYISLTRNPEPIINSETKKYFDILLEDTCRSVDYFEYLLETEKPDTVSIFNGRWYEQKAAFDLSKHNHIPLRVNEVVGGFRSRTDNLRYIYHNCMPHDIANMTKTIQQLWDYSDEPIEEKIKKGKDFFERRRHGIIAGDRVYTGKQKKGSIPNVDPSKKNIVIFNSSEDEFASIGEDFESLSLFDSQLDGINYICEELRNKPYHIYLRVHPNLSKITYRYHIELYNLEAKYDNLTVIPADAQCDSYALLDIADKVVVFGSSLGIEACYWNKPVILLRASFYYYLGACYIPKSKKEVIEMIQQDLIPKEQLPAIKYGYMIMNRQLFAIPFKHLDMHTVRINIIKCKVLTTAYPKLLHSAVLMQIVRSIIVIISRNLFGTINLPDPIHINRIVE